MLRRYVRASGRSSQILLAFLLLTLTALLAPTDAIVSAENSVDVPVLGAIRANDRGVFEMMALSWDQQASPAPIKTRWRGNVEFMTEYLDAMRAALKYAQSRTPEVRHTGTISIKGVAYVSTGTDGPSAGAVTCVGFIALLRGDPIRRGVAMTGTIQPDGRIGPVGAIPDKIRAAAREGYRTVLVPQGQIHDSQWNLEKLGLELNVTVKAVGTIDEAYELMTGRKL